MIGTSDGEQFATPFEHSISASGMGPTATEKPAGALKTDLGTQVAMDMSRLPESTNIEDRRGYKGPVNGSLGEILRSGNPNQAIDRNTTIVNVNRAARDANDRHEGLDTTETGTAVYGLDPSVAKVLSQPHIAEAIANPKIDRTHDVPYVAGASAKPDDFTTHVDQHIPTTATISGKTFDPAIPLNIHEQVEREVMNNLIKKGMTDEKAYEIAHHEYAEPAEDAWYKAQGIDVKDVNKWWDQQNKVTEKEKATDLKFPPNLYKKPYPHDEVEGMKHEHSNVSAEWATSTKIAMNDKFVPFDPMQPKYSNPGGHEHVEPVVNPGRATKLEKDIQEFQTKNNLPLNNKEQTIKAIQSRVRQIENDRRTNKKEGEDYPPHPELFNLKNRLKELSEPDMIPQKQQQQQSNASAESIYSPAIRDNSTGEIHMGINHGEAAAQAGFPKDWHEGFVTSKGRYVSREEAADIAKQADQLHRVYKSGGVVSAPKRLLSEDLKDTEEPYENIREVLKHFFQNSEPKK